MFVVQSVTNLKFSYNGFNDGLVGEVLSVQLWLLISELQLWL